MRIARRCRHFAGRNRRALSGPVSYTHLDVYKRQAFYIGGTKNGMLMGEAVVVLNSELKAGYRHIMKQRGGICLLYTSRCV